MGTTYNLSWKGNNVSWWHSPHNGFSGSFGTLLGDAGLLYWLYDSDVYATETAKKMLQGKQYSRGIRDIKLVHEAFFACSSHL